MFNVRKKVHTVVTFSLKKSDAQFPDGGEISIDWADDTMSRNLPEDAPILAILHTITGKL